MANRSSILDAVHVAIRNTNEALPIDKKIGLSESERIIGTGAKIDSLAFVTLMVAVEKEVESAVGSCPSLVEELSDSSADVATLGQLIDYISERQRSGTSKISICASIQESTLSIPKARPSDSAMAGCCLTTNSL